MMSIELAKRVVGCKGWRWLPGMLARGRGHRVIDADGGNVEVFYDAKGDCVVAEPIQGPGVCEFWDELRPDLTDPATIGCLLGLVRDAWSDHGIGVVCATYIDGDYQFRVVEGHHHGGKFRSVSIVPHSTEAGALVAMLEAAS